MHIHRPDPPQAAELQRWQDALRVCTSWHWIQKRNFAALRYVNFVRVYLRKHRRVRCFFMQMCEVSLHFNTFATLLVLTRTFTRRSASRARVPNGRDRTLCKHISCYVCCLRVALALINKHVDSCRFLYALTRARYPRRSIPTKRTIRGSTVLPR